MASATLPLKNMTTNRGNEKVLGIKEIKYTVINDENGQQFKTQFLKKYDVINVEEDENAIVITVGEIFDTNDFMWV